MLLDILVALAIVVIAVWLGLTVHPLFWFIIILAAIWLFTRHRAGGGWGTRRYY